MTTAQPQPPSASATGDVVGGRYRLEEPIGRGGMATIWRAVHLDLHRPVALKFLTIHGGDAHDVRERFLREARIAAAVRHRNVVDITDFGTTDGGGPFMVMELLEGESLAQRMARDPTFTIPEVVRLGAAALSGLAAVHDAGIVHRDLKPENVFLVRDAEGTYPKLLDFGISRSVEAGLESAIPSTDSILAGTPQYMSPEQARGLKDVDSRSDLWAMGVILYEMLTGALPYDSEHTGDLIITILTEDPLPVQRLRPDLGPQLALVVSRALTRDRATRFQSAREMRQALLEAAAATAAELSEVDGELEPERVSVAPEELMAAVDRSYEPGDSGVLNVADGTMARRPAAPAPGRPSSDRPTRAGPVAGRGRRLLWVVAGALGIAALAGALALEGRPASGSEQGAEPPVAQPPELEPTITVTLRRVPARASITLDGQAREGPALALPRDGTDHVIEVNAPGFEPWRVTHRGDWDAAYEVALTPLRAPAAPEDAETVRPRVAPGELMRDPGF